MTFAGAIKTCLTKYADFRGVASRSEYWYFILFTFLVSIVLGTIDSLIFPTTSDSNPLAMSLQPSPFSDIASLLLLLPTIAVLVRRMRDAGFSAKWLLLMILPVLVLLSSLVAAAPALADFSLSNESSLVALALAVLPGLGLAAAVQLFYFVVTLLKSKAPAKAAPTEQIQDQTGTTA